MEKSALPACHLCPRLFMDPIPQFNKILVSPITLLDALVGWRDYAAIETTQAVDIVTQLGFKWEPTLSIPHFAYFQPGGIPSITMMWRWKNWVDSQEKLERDRQRSAERRESWDREQALKEAREKRILEYIPSLEAMGHSKIRQRILAEAVVDGKTTLERIQELMASMMKS